MNEPFTDHELCAPGLDRVVARHIVVVELADRLLSLVVRLFVVETLADAAVQTSEGTRALRASASRRLGRTVGRTQHGSARRLVDRGEMHAVQQTHDAADVCH